MPAPAVAALPTDCDQIRFPAARRAELQRLPLAAFGPRSALVRTTTTLISTGTETIAFGQRFDPGPHWARSVRYPFAAGYSHVGGVEAVGAEVRRVAPGDRVASWMGHASRGVIDEDGL